MDNNAKESSYEKVMRKYRDKKKKLPVPLNELDSIEKIINVLKYVPLTMAQRDLYEEKLKILRDEDGALETARIKGLEEGRKEGLIEVAKKALMKGFSEEEVSEITGLSKEEIINIKCEINS